MQQRKIVIRGIVGKGQGRGNEVGAPTANLDLSLASDLTKGLYACAITLAEREFSGLLYYGINSLINEDCLEVHLLDFKGDLYGQEISVNVGQYLRPPKKFKNVAQLSAQIRQDLESVVKHQN